MDLRTRERTGLPLLIAEVGFNHEGKRETAAAMIHAAARAGAVAVKFQTFRAADLALPDAPHFELIRSGEMGREDALFLAAEARACGIAFFSTPFSTAAVDILEEAGVPAYKVASMDLATPYLLDAVAATGKPVILSTGMSTLPEIDAAVERLGRAGAKDIGLLHCLSLYPAQAADLNLAAMGELKRRFGLPTGWSDHFPGAKACLAAFCAGADIIETHFTLDTTTPGGDHGHSADPAMLRGLREDMALFAAMQGRADVFEDRPDRRFAPVYRRGVYAARDLAAGQALAAGDLLFCRPESPLTPRDLDTLLGRTLARPVAAQAALDPTDLGD
ncbi:MAG: N-acetylneuraminate synthase family protein [Thermodesulfobacteriota bacterium]